MSNKDISSFQIDHSKIWTDGEKYFSLFEKHIPELNAGQKVLVYAIDNLDVICKLMDRGNGAEFWIFGNSDVNAGVKALGYDFNEIPNDDFSKTYNIPDMKFDCIIMNPPYERDLHLKILTEAQDHINSSGKVICLHPGKWLQRFDYWKTKSKIKVEDADFVDELTSRNTFDAAIGSNLVVSIVSNNGTTDYKKYSKFIPWVKDKIIDQSIVLASKDAKFRTTNPNDQFILNLPIIHGHIGCYDMTEITSKNYERALNVKFGKRPQDINSIKFNSELERKNFYNSTFTKFYKF